MKKYCYINGRITEEKNAKISPYDLGILRGYGIFDFMCTTNEKPFLFNEHWIRLNNSAKSLNLKVPVNKLKLKSILKNLIKKNSYKNPSIRIVLTAGISKNGITLPEKPTFYILLHDTKKLVPSPELYKKGAKIITHDFKRDNHTVKTTNYMEPLKKQAEKNRRFAVEILYTDKNNVLECSTSNIFIVKNNRLFTPKDDVLLGVTRKLVLKLAKKNGIKIKEQKISKNQLFSADEVFITGSAKHILPIVKIDKQKIGNGKPGQITQQLSELYLNYLNNY